MSEKLNLDPRVGDAILQLIEQQTGRACHIALIVCPMEGAKLGQPEFVTSLHPDEMESLITQIAGGFVMAGKRTIAKATHQ
jgi:hypothetical protein